MASMTAKEYATSMRRYYAAAKERADARMSARQPTQTVKAAIYHTWWTVTITAPDGERTEVYCAMEPVTRAQALDRLTAMLPADERVSEMHEGVSH